MQYHKNICMYFLKYLIRKAQWLAERSKIETLCMYCHKHLRGPKNSKIVSHGLCKQCFHLAVGTGKTKH